MYPKAVVFDFDGVIVDTEPFHYRAFQKILVPLGLGYTWNQYTDYFMGFDDRDAFREAFKLGGLPLDDARLSELINIKAGIFQEVISEGVTAYPGVVNLVRQLRKNGTALAICSGALKSDIVPILRYLEIESCFSEVISAEDVIHSKPDPASYVLAKDMLQKRLPQMFAENNDQMIAIEDTPAGVASAKGAGLQVIAVTNSYPADKLHEADKIVTSLEELDFTF